MKLRCTRAGLAGVVLVSTLAGCLGDPDPGPADPSNALPIGGGAVLPAATPREPSPSPISIDDTVGAGSCTQVAYHGGRVLDHVKIQNIFWGSYWNDTSPTGGAALRAQVDQAWRVIGNSRVFYGPLAQYGSFLQLPGPGQYLGAVTNNTDPATSVYDVDVQDMLRLVIAFGLVPSNTDQNMLYVVYLPKGVTSHPDVDKNPQWGGHHDTFTSTANGLRVYYATITPSTSLDSLTLIASHEIDEATADPDPYAGLQAWDEIGDPCQNLSPRGFRFRGYWLERVWSRADCGCVTTLAQPFRSKHDITWRDTVTGDVAMWQMNGSSSVRSWATVAPQIPSQWQIMGTGDFDGDGEGDLLWYNSATSQVGVWAMRGLAVANWNAVPNMATVPGAQIQGVGDFDGDGLSDVLWRNPSTGAVTIVFTGAQFSPLSPTFAAGTSWSIYGVGDFDGDHKTDILWRNFTTGEVGLWLMNGTTVKSYPVAASGIGYRFLLAGVGDFDGDGKADILWRDFANDDLSVWFMNGGQISSNQLVAHNVSFEWALQGVADLDADGRDDIIWRDIFNGDVGAWLMNGSTPRTMDTPSHGLSADWQIAGMPADQTF